MSCKGLKSYPLEQVGLSDIYQFAYLFNHYNCSPLPSQHITVNLSYVFDLQHPFSGQNPTDLPKHVSALAHCLKKPTGKRAEVTDNGRVRKPSTLIISNSSVRFISYLHRINTSEIQQFQCYSSIHIRAVDICSISAAILCMKSHRASFTRTTLLYTTI